MNDNNIASPFLEQQVNNFSTSSGQQQNTQPILTQTQQQIQAFQQVQQNQQNFSTQQIDTNFDGQNIPNNKIFSNSNVNTPEVFQYPSQPTANNLLNQPEQIFNGQNSFDQQQYLGGNDYNNNTNVYSNNSENDMSFNTQDITSNLQSNPSQDNLNQSQIINNESFNNFQQISNNQGNQTDFTTSIGGYVSPYAQQLSSQQITNTDVLQPESNPNYNASGVEQNSMDINSDNIATAPNTNQTQDNNPNVSPNQSSNIFNQSESFDNSTNIYTTNNSSSDQNINTTEELNPQNIYDVKTNTTIKKERFKSISELLDKVLELKGSDLHIAAGYPPTIRIDDILRPVGDTLTKEEVKNFVFQSLSQGHKELLEINKEVDLSYQHEDKARFRINAYFARNSYAAAYRLIPQRIRSLTELGLPNILLELTKYSQGLFLVTGPTGSGKSTTLAAMIQHINETEAKHILTIEDPIEYVYPKAKAFVSQREIGTDTHDWNIALRSALREDPDVILVGELRDLETIQSALTLSETGHLVFATLHTNSAAQSIDRIIDVFPPHQQEQIKNQLAGVLKGILSQRLVPLIGGGRKAVIELMIVTPAIQNLIREGKVFQIDNVIATSADLGMIQLEKSLVQLIRAGAITVDTAFEYAIRPNELQKMLKINM